MRTFWLSFVNERGFAGVAIMDVTPEQAQRAKAMLNVSHPHHAPDAEWLAAAITASHLAGCNPGGQVAAFEVSDGDEPALAAAPRATLMLKPELAERGFEPKSLKEIDEMDDKSDTNKSDDTPRTDLPYMAAMHGIQSGVAMAIGRDPRMVEPKHLRVGLNSAMVNDAALVRLLVKKGVFTMDEYLEEVRLEACREVDRLEDTYNAEIGAGDASRVRFR
jgi:hypothetical protein